MAPRFTESEPIQGRNSRCLVGHSRDRRSHLGTLKVHVALWYIPGPESYYTETPLRPKHMLYRYTDTLNPKP